MAAMTDIVERLLAKDAEWQKLCDRWDQETKGKVSENAVQSIRPSDWKRAADEIERLRAEISRLEAIVQTMRDMEVRDGRMQAWKVPR